MFKKQQLRLRPVRKNCPYCHEGRVPDYKNYDELRKYMTERGRILSRARTGICTKHQRQIDQQIKRARHLAYLPFVAGL